MFDDIVHTISYFLDFKNTEHLNVIRSSNHTNSLSLIP